MEDFQVGELVEWQGQQGRVRSINGQLLILVFDGCHQYVDKSEVTRVKEAGKHRPASAQLTNVNEYGFSTDYQTRKNQPIVTGVLDYFPLAILAVAEVSQAGNQQHNPNEPLHWAREKSQDEINTALRHIQERGSYDGKVRHLAKAAWRILAALQKEIEQDLCPSTQCEVHVLNKDCGGSCSLLPRAATWYGRNRDGKKVLP